MSTDTLGQAFHTDTPDRSDIPEKHFHIYRPIFSRNTLGGALGKYDTYQLPGGAETDNFDLTIRYNLNYLCTGNVGCDDPGEYKNAVVIHFQKSTLVVE